MSSENSSANNRFSEKLAIIMFSKDRAMQLDAALHSYFLHCGDPELADIKVICVTSPGHEARYAKLASEYSRAEFFSETNFKDQLLSCMKDYGYVSFQVDDNLFVKDFSTAKILDQLKNNNDAIGFSMRLGMNTTYCYMLNHEQKLPDFTQLDDETLKYPWASAVYDFGYPLEGSGSVYRAGDLYPLLERSGIRNPNELEYVMYCNIYGFPGKTHLLCMKNSIVFNNPVNIVQSFCVSNRFGESVCYSTAELGELYDKGYRVDVEKLSGFVPNACHQEVALEFVQI